MCSSDLVKFSRSGRIEVAASICDDASDSGAAVLEIRVSDQGIGIEGQPVERLFEPFRQGDGSSTREFGGIGLGLSLSHTIARSLNGDVSLRPNACGGTTATLRIPVSREPPRPVADEQGAPSSRNEAQPVA